MAYQTVLFQDVRSNAEIDHFDHFIYSNYLLFGCIVNVILTWLLLFTPNPSHDLVSIN